jgi:hypothetical protein
MKITLLKNMTGVIHGSDLKRIECDKAGILRIGTTEINISPETDSILPLLFHGATGDYTATFTDKYGNVYKLEKVAVRTGRIVPPSPTEVEILELRVRADSAEAECEALREEIQELRNIFDTNSLNFLIK